MTLTERYQGCSLPALRRDGSHEDVDPRPGQTSIHSGFTAINQHQQKNTPQSDGEVGGPSDADTHVNTSHAVEHPIVAQYLGLGLDDADIPRFERRQATMPPVTSKKSPHTARVSPALTNKQIKDMGKKRSASAPQAKPAKKAKRSRPDDGRADVAAAASASKTTTRSNKKSSSAKSIGSNKENAPPHDTQRQGEASPSEGFALSEQTAQKLNAWRFQASPSTSRVIDSDAHSICNTDNQTDSPSSFSSSAVAPVQNSVSAFSTAESESQPEYSSFPLSSLTASTVKSATFDSHSARFASGTSPSIVRNSYIERLSSPSSLVTPDYMNDAQGDGRPIYSNPPPSASDNRPTTLKSHPVPQFALASTRPPPTNRRDVLETIFEESPSSSIEPARASFGYLQDPSLVLDTNSTEPSSTGIVLHQFEDDVFDDLDDGDLLDLELSSAVATSATRQTSETRTDQAVQFVPPVVICNVDTDIIDIVSDDEWNILEDEEVAFVDLTDGTAHVARPLPISKTRDWSRTEPATRFQARSEHGIGFPHPQTAPSQHVQASPQRSFTTAAEATEDYLNAILHPPITRPPFPKPIRDRSPLIGVTPSPLLKTCFRIGECLNVGCTSARNSNTQSSDNILIELYAKVVSSHRDVNGVTQYFVLADLFHEKRGPFLDAVCETWRGCELWEYDCARFLCVEPDGETKSPNNNKNVPNNNENQDSSIENKHEKKLCRAVGKMKREIGGKWKFVVLNIWEATWEDVEFVRGIVCGG